MKIFTGNSNPQLARMICKNLEVRLSSALVKRFSDGEIWIEIGENVRGRDVFVIQSTCSPANENIIELLIMIDALKRASAGRITAVIPYYGYARQDRKSAPRTPISAKLIADLLTVAGADRILTVDLHAGQIQGFFNIPVDNLYALPVLLGYVRENLLDELVFVSPDAGGVARTRAYAKRVGKPIAIIDKRREIPNVSEVMNVVGDVKGKTCIIVDDIVDTAGTITQAADALMNAGAKGVIGLCTHPVLSGRAVEHIANSSLSKLIVTDTIPLKEEAKRCEKIEVLSVAKLLAEAIKRIHEESSISELFE